MEGTAVEYEVQRVRLDRTMSRRAVTRLLIDAAEYRGWELQRLRRYRDGTRDAWMRRKIHPGPPDHGLNEHGTTIR